MLAGKSQSSELCEHCGGGLDEGFCMNVHCNMGIYDPIVIDRSIQDCDGGLEDIFDTYPELDDEYAIELYELED